MPQKGIYTQCVAILLRQAVPLAAVEELLGDFNVVKRNEGLTRWPFGGPYVLLAYRPDVNGYVSIDMFDKRWPDPMGDPNTDLEVFGAWSMGHFGPGTWPGALERACQHSWTWPDGRTIPLQHEAFILIRCSYTLGTPENAPVIFTPKDYEPVHELEFVTRIAAVLVRLPQTLCFFNPSGECVRGVSEFLRSQGEHASTEQMPLDLWSNVRFFKLENVNPAWYFMDTVGMSQLDAPDHEAFFQSGAYEPGYVDPFLRTMSAYVVEQGPIIRDGDTADGPGDVRWQGFNIGEGRIATPPREVIRWFPLDGRKAPPELTRGTNE